MDPPGGVPAGWDAADDLASGYDEAQAVRLIAAATKQERPRKTADERDQGGGRRRGRPPQRDELMRYVEAIELWHDDANKAYATCPDSGHRVNAPIRSSQFRQWLTLQYLDGHEAAPGKTALEECLSAVEARAVQRGKRYTACIRVAECDGRVFLDLCNDDWQAIECSKSGWAIVDNVPVKFVRRDGMLPLPIPDPVTEQQSGVEELRSFFGNLSQGHFALVVAWVMGCLRDTGVYPVLMIPGESGPQKTIFTHFLTDPIDPPAARP